MLTRKQFVEWMAFKKIRGPFGDERSDHFSALIAMHAGAGNYEKKPQLTDFLPWRPPHFSKYEFEGDELDDEADDEE